MKTQYRVILVAFCSFTFFWGNAHAQEFVLNEWKTLSINNPYVVNSICFSPDGKLVASALTDHSIKIWSVEKGTELITLSKHSDNVYSVCFSPDGKLLASGSSDQTIRLWSVETGLILRMLSGHKGIVTSIAFSPDGIYLASGSWNNKVRLWSLVTEKEIRTFPPRSFVVFSPDGKYLASGGDDDEIKIHIVKTGKEIRKFKDHSGSIHSICFSPDGKLLASGGGDGTIRIWSVETGTEFRRIVGDTSSVNSVSFSPNGKLLASGGGGQFSLRSGTVKLWSVETGQELKTLSSNTSRVFSVVFSPDGKYLASGSFGTIKIWKFGSVEPSSSIEPSEKVDLDEFRKRIVEALENINKKGSSQNTSAPPKKPETKPPVLTLKPPVLSFEPEFTEPSGNQLLDAEETGTLKLTISNTGAGPAQNVVAKLNTTLLPMGLSFSPELAVGVIAARDKRTISFPLTASETIPSQTVTFRIEVLEANGFDADPQTLTFSTRELLPPDLQLTEYAMDDDAEGESQGNNNGKMEPGELVEVTAIIQNKGRGEAQELGATVMLKAENAFYQSAAREFSLGTLAPGQWKKITFAVSTNKRYAQPTLPLTLSLSERRKRFNQSVPLSLELNKVGKRLQEIIVSGKEDPQIASEVAMPGLAVDVDKAPTTLTKNPDAIAVVIGNSVYDNKYVPPVDFALRDAEFVKDYLLHTLGFREGNIIAEKNATKAIFERIFGTARDYQGQLYNYTKGKNPDVFVYYSGHGVPDPENKQGYFIPRDCDPQYVRFNGYALSTFYENLAKLEAKSLMVVIDACFSGVSEKGALLPEVSPIFIKVENPLLAMDNGMVMTASTGDQVSRWYSEKKHGLFTYFFLKGLQGEADTDRNKLLTFAELAQYVQENVAYTSRRLGGYEQTPQVVGKEKQRVLVKY